MIGVIFAEGAKPAPDPELLAASAILHELGLTHRYSAQGLWSANIRSGF